MPYAPLNEGYIYTFVNLLSVGCTYAFMSAKLGFAQSFSNHFHLFHPSAFSAGC